MSDLQATTVTGEGTVLLGAELESLRGRLSGQLLRSGDDGYDSARELWNAMIDHRPALVARCAAAADVVEAMRFARQHDLLISVRGGGHSVAGKSVCEGGLLIDLSLMKGIRIDADARTAHVEPGVLWGELDDETHKFGLATPGGVVATTGIAGLTLGGGQSWLTGKYGLTIDSLLSADVVMVDSHLLHADSEENADLFWGLRGAGANLGVVTSFEYRLHPVSTVVGGMALHPIDRAPEVLRFYREFTASEPDELTTYAALLTAPDGTPMVALLPCYIGSAEDAHAVLEPLRQFGPPVADTIAEITHPEMQGIITAAFPAGRSSYWKSGLTAKISDELIGTLVEFARRVPSPFSAIVIANCHGASARVGKTDTAYYHRDLQYDVVLASAWTDPGDSDTNIEWTRECFEQIEPHLADAVYVNDLGDEPVDRVRSAYGDNYDRIVELKRKYDPTNFLRMNQNIMP